LTIITQFNFDEEQITAQISDEYTDFLWTAFAQNSSDVCYLKKQSSSKPSVNYYTLNRLVDEINALDLDSSNIYTSYDDNSLLGEIISKTNPLTSVIEISKAEYPESPVDVKVNGTDLWFLLPGSLSGINATLIKYNTSGVYQDEVDLTGVVDAKSMVIDENDDIWVVTYTSPANLVRVYEESGGAYNFEINEIS